MSHLVLVNAGVLAMVMNALKRDAEEGKASRGEMLEELKATVIPYEPPSHQPPQEEWQYLLVWLRTAAEQGWGSSEGANSLRGRLCRILDENGGEFPNKGLNLGEAVKALAATTKPQVNVAWSLPPNWDDVKFNLDH